MTRIDLSFVSITNLIDYLEIKEKEPSERDLFTISINGTEFSLPMEIAICYSNYILSLFRTDLTTRRCEINCKFLNENSTEKIVNLFLDPNFSKLQFDSNSLEELIDLMVFGKEFDCDIINSQITSIFSKNSDQITEENALLLLSSFLNYGYFDIVEKVISFISQHFYSFAEKNEFIQWFCKNEYDEVLESIINNEFLKLESENQLLQFLIKLCTKKNKFEHLFGLIHLKYCDSNTINLFINYI